MEVRDATKLSQEEVNERLAILQYKVFESRIEEVWARFSEAGFEPILIKGWAAAQLYPEPYRRRFVDIDLMVSPQAFDEAAKFTARLKSEFLIDLHRGARHLDSLGFEDLFSNSIVMRCGTTWVRVLRPEDHLRLLCVHWLNDGGADRERLWDIYYAVSNRLEDFDWDRLLNSVSPKRRKWVVCAIGLTHKYLGLDIENTPISDEAKKLPNWLIKAIEKEWASGVRLLPLHFFLGDKKMLWKQIKKRIPPNPIQATIELEGEFDDKPRIGYQLRDIFFRVPPAVKRIRQVLSAKPK